MSLIQYIYINTNIYYKNDNNVNKHNKFFFFFETKNKIIKL